jgi:hypothetical protein
MALMVNLSIMIILMIFISFWVPYSKTLIGFNSFKHDGHLGLQLPSNGPKSIIIGRVHGKCGLKFGH